MIYNLPDTDKEYTSEELEFMFNDMDTQIHNTFGGTVSSIFQSNDGKRYFYTVNTFPVHKQVALRLSKKYFNSEFTNELKDSKFYLYGSERSNIQVLL